MTTLVQVRPLLVLSLLIACSDPPRPEPREPRPEPRPRTIDPIETPPEPELVFPPAIRIADDDERAIDAAMHAAISAGDLPGAVIAVGRRDGIVFRRAYGMASLEPERRAMEPDMLFDLASVTKLLTTIAALRLRDAGALDLDRPIDRILPELAGWGITPRHLLLHTAGFRPVIPLTEYDDDRAASLSRALRSAPEQRPGTYAYSDLSFIALGALLERITEQSLDAIFDAQIFGPVGATDAGFNPGVHALAKPSPDFITLNEVESVSLPRMRSAVPGYDAYREKLPADGDDAGQAMGSAIMWRTDKWTMLDGGRIYIFASKGGADTHPDWYRNLVAHPEITVELGTDTFPATARVLEGAERDAVYARQVAAEPQFGEYQRKTERIIPVVELVRAS